MSYFVRLSLLVIAGFLALAPSATVYAQEKNEEWTVVYIGDSGLPQAVRFFADQIRADFDVDVFFTQRNSALVPHATQMLRGGTWDIVGDAEVVIVSISVGNDRPGYCTDQEGEDPIRWSNAEIGSMISEFLLSMAELSDAESQIVRIANEPVLPDDLKRWIENDHVAECLAIIESINEAWLLGAQKYGFKVVDVFEAWSGPDGTAQPPSGYYMPDNRHLTAEGAQAIALLLRATGYEPLAQ